MKVSLLRRKDTLNTSRDFATLIFGATPASFGLVLAELLGEPEEIPTIVVCPDERILSSLEESLEFYFEQRLARGDDYSITTLDESNSPYLKLLPVVHERRQRLCLLAQLHTENKRQRICLVSAAAALRSFMPVSAWKNLTREFKAGQDLEPKVLEQWLIQSGFERRDLVEDYGTYSIRGGIVDIFPLDHEKPVRLEFFDTLLESIRSFNPETQRSEKDLIPSLSLIPAREFSCDPESLQATRERIKKYCDDEDIPKNKRDQLSELLARGIAPLELDHLLPFAHTHCDPFWKHAPKDARWIFIEPDIASEITQAVREKLSDEAGEAKANREIIPPLEEWVRLWPDLAHETQGAIWLKQLDTHPEIPSGNKFQITSEAVNLNPANKQEWDRIASRIKDWQDLGFRIYFVANSETQLDRFGFFLHQRNIGFLRGGAGVDEMPIEARRVVLQLGAIEGSFALAEDRLAYLSEDDVFGHRQHAKKNKATRGHQNFRADLPHLKSLDNLQVDDLVVHLEHGLGYYKGIITLKASGASGDFVVIEYADKDKLYVPIYRLDLLQKYIGAGGYSPKADRLGTAHFQKAKERVKESVKDIAADLLRLYAQRASLKGYQFSPPDENFHAFAASFPYDETTDQAKAIDDTIRDMCSPRPMDRLVCGDVGFGKTEVALRAAMKACLDHKQVAVLVPTTILAEQHFQTFVKRFRDFPIQIASLSRFRSRKEQKEILDNLKAGKIDIIIGTHRLLSKDVAFHDLGLLIIDEEQRFGVEHKEKLKRFRANTDVLTLTATPIPRTLHMALSGLRDISLIQTAPADRLPIRTYISPYDAATIKSAVDTELSRGGQIFFLHNRVQTIGSVEAALREIMPSLRIGVGHGQMSEHELEKVMTAFYRHEIDLLLCTAIVENGLDVPNANTIIVNRADTFGLSQLYQLRGRVGRSQTRAFAYLLIPENGRITDEARERLQLLQRFAELGSGYAIASYDLEMRGGGELLGAEQSGHVAQVGYDLYLELLQEEIARLKGEAKERPEDVEINSAFPAVIPETYVQDMRTRLSLYKRLSEYQSEELLSDAASELEDRYGALPPETKELFSLLRLKQLLRRIGMRAVQISKNGVTLTAGPKLQIKHDELLERAKKDPEHYTFTREGKLMLRHDIRSIGDAVYAIRHYLPGLS